MRRALLAAAYLTTGCAASEPDGPHGRPEPQASETLAPTTCRFVVPASVEGTTVKCYDVLVPERHDRPDGRRITLHVARFPGHGELPPTIELIGGPGAGGDSIVGYIAAGEPATAELYDFLRGRGDYLIFDQRGVGRSLPNLSCAEENTSTSPASTLEGVVTKCRDRLTAEGVDLGAYTTYESALDVDDIRKAFGYAKVDLHGISYGTLLALEVMRQRPDAVRAAIIDGVLAPDAAFFTDRFRHYDEDLTRIFAACAAQAACNAAFPDLEASFASLQEKLSAKELEPPSRSNEEPLRLYALEGRLVHAMYAPEGVRQIPAWVHELNARGDEAYAELLKKESEAIQAFGGPETELGLEVGRRLADLSADSIASQKYLGINDGMYQSVMCSDYAQYEDAAVALERLKDLRPIFRDESGVNASFEICRLWPKGERRDVTRRAVTSDIPTLSLGGEFDPVTPPSAAERVTRTLARGQYVFQKGLAHGSLDACARQLEAAFLGDPLAKADASCSSARTLTFATSFADVGAYHRARRGSAWAGPPRTLLPPRFRAR